MYAFGCVSIIYVNVGHSVFLREPFHIHHSICPICLIFVK